MDQRTARFSGLVRGCFTIWTCSLGGVGGARSQSHYLRTLLLHRRALQPCPHATDETDLVRLHDPGRHGGFACRRGADVEFSYRPCGQRHTAVFPVIYTSIMVILHRRVGGPATAAVLANAIPGLAGFGMALLTLHLTAVPLGSASALLIALFVSVAWNLMLYVLQRQQLHT